MDPHFAYRQSAIQGANPVRLVILLYEQAARDLRRAAVAINAKDIEGRTRYINHALDVLGQLQASLDMERGGQVSQDLAFFYNMVRGKIIDAQIQASRPILLEQAGFLSDLREAWIKVEQDVIKGQADSSAEPKATLGPKTVAVESGVVSSAWSA